MQLILTSKVGTANCQQHCMHSANSGLYDAVGRLLPWGKMSYLDPATAASCTACLRFLLCVIVPQVWCLMHGLPALPALCYRSSGLDWVATHAVKPAVVIMSLGVTGGAWARALEDSVGSLLRDHGITVIVASGGAFMHRTFVGDGHCPESGGQVCGCPLSLGNSTGQTSPGRRLETNSSSNTDQMLMTTCERHLPQLEVPAWRMISA